MQVRRQGSVASSVGAAATWHRSGAQRVSLSCVASLLTLRRCMVAWRRLDSARIIYKGRDVIDIDVGLDEVFAQKSCLRVYSACMTSKDASKACFFLRSCCPGRLPRRTRHAPAGLPLGLGVLPAAVAHVARLRRLETDIAHVCFGEIAPGVAFFEVGTAGQAGRQAAVCPAVPSRRPSCLSQTCIEAPFQPPAADPCTDRRCGAPAGCPAARHDGRLLLRHLELKPDAVCLLPGGQMVAAAALASPAGQAQLAGHAAAGVLGVQERISEDLLEPQNPLEAALRLPRLPARCIVVTSAAGEAVGHA